jgi:HD superfamily phosphohydrolase YqeK
MSNCPGQDRRNAHSENIICTHCGYAAEIFSDEFKVACPQCKNLICKERLPTCLDWCKAAKECLGDQPYQAYREAKGVILQEKLIKELEDHFGNDAKRINHAKKVLRFAQELLKQEKADWEIVVAASILHDVGIKPAEERFGSSAGNLQEALGPQIARQLLSKLGVEKEKIEEICQIIAHHHSPGKINTLNFKVLYDADWLVNLKDEVDIEDKHKVKGIIEKVFLTKTGEAIARQLYL